MAFGFVERGGFVVAVWLGADFIILGAAHERGAHRVFGKRADGALPLIRAFSREPARSVVTEQLVIGRRLLASEFDGEFDNVVDLTAEFAEPSAIRRSPAYRSFPILDGGAPDPEALHAAVASLRPGRTFIHCAQGHGRTGLFALAVLLHAGAARSVEEGLAMLSAARPGIRLNREQLQCIQMFARELG